MVVAPFIAGSLKRITDGMLQSRASVDLLSVAERISDDYESTLALRRNLTMFRDRIVNRTGGYGDYDRVECSFVRFDGGAEAVGVATDALKVTVANKGAVFTLLFPYRQY